MLVGMLSPTAGNAFLLNKDIKNNMDDIRQHIGLCPQHDILYPELTILEHLEIFGQLKNMEKGEMKLQIDNLIKDLEMEKYKNMRVKTLSGGYKRKVSVALAFIGNPKIIFLDEPSSGLDIGAKHKLWDKLKQYKEGRIIILTTHYMEEADYLGDRIAIMGEGTIRTIGSSMFLKNKFGVGYTLNIYKQKDDAQENQKVVSYVTQQISTAIHEPDISTQLSFKLPFDTLN
jgi:ATP-binding cassette subfamily A (ABC1) protein 3